MIGQIFGRSSAAIAAAWIILLILPVARAVAADAGADPPTGVCPPFMLRDEAGTIINPRSGENAAVPWSPRKTCGGCHKYDTITAGYHFTQGAGEGPTAAMRRRAAWVTTPGNFGGNWCSPAPLYRYLSPKENDTAATIDMTAYTFLSACGSCHPGGGSAEYDRDGHRYDQWIAEPESGLTDGGDNGLDGDYHKARWQASGVLEADCLLCHLPGYQYAERSRQIKRLNYRWAATAGSGLAVVRGSTQDGEPVTVLYDSARFNSDGTIDLPMVRSPRNEACLSCHEQPGWKKRGTNFRSRTDVHLRAGLRCVDCHPAGSSASDPRIAGREVHQIAKGDDPGGNVRNDLDDTMVTCAGCHDSGRLGAPRAVHNGLPPLHLERIACQTCHIPERAVMPIQFQASDVFNSAPRIPSGGKQLWTFYGPDGEWRNHYGFIEMMGYDDKPTESFRPIVTRYKGKLYPVNRIHSAWPGIETDGDPALMQPRMSDIRKMWTAHRANPEIYPALARITDDNGDRVLEVNRAEEIDALIASVTQLLTGSGYPMAGKRVVWVQNDRSYRSGADFRTIDKEPWEASPYANVHKYSHDIYPATAALGAAGCGDCHSAGSPIMFGQTLRYPFDDQAQPLLMPQSELTGIHPLSARAGALRESLMKPALLFGFPILFMLCLLHYVAFGPQPAPAAADPAAQAPCSTGERLAHAGLLLTFIALAATGFIPFFTHWLPSLTIATVYLVHRIAGAGFVIFLLITALYWWRDSGFRRCDWLWWKRLGGYFGGCGEVPSEGRFNAGQKTFFWIIFLMGGAITLTGALLILWPHHPVAGLWFTIHAFLAGIMALGALAHFYIVYFLNPDSVGKMLRGGQAQTGSGVHGR